MQESARAFLAGLVDYAGLFPPAALDLDTTARNYAAYLRGSEAWMLGRLIIPATRLSELLPLRREAGDPSRPWLLSVLSAAPERWEALPQAAIAVAGKVAKALDDGGDRVEPDVFEQKLPPVPAAPVAGLEDYAAALDEHLSAPAGVFFEAALTPRDPTAIRDVQATVEALGELAVRRSAPGGRFLEGGFKLRCGGVEAGLYPDVDLVVAALLACRRAGVAMKATAGLHHPLRHFRPDLGVYEHGFLNVFGAGVLLDVHDLDEQAVRRIVAEEDPSAFVFDGAVFRWRDLAATAEQVVVARRRRVTSFGSCSFDEPREDLRQLGHL
ncbi:MAG: hypothetical protein Q9Q40_09235 [Acidobacteriota bacterium]|nr:hypothetical protein [Acidobacteriota bacterium]MDQ7087598.1 hypothetical protein [Acidobacteriota bacterium]